MHALIVDDEPLARAHLRRALEAQGVSDVSEADSGTKALEALESEPPDVVFLDIQMPGLTGLQTAAAMSHSGNSPVVVFVTGYSEHAVSAFEHDALDYVLKPVSADRLATTLTKVRDSIKAKRLRERTAQAAATRKLQAARPKRLPIRVGNSVRLVRIDRILCATARDKHVYVRTRDEEFRTYYTLTQLEGLLPPERFMRIHASCIVDVESIEELVLWGNHSYSVKLPLGIDLPVGRQGYPELQARLGVTEVKKAAEE